jgi:hypothetical protein
MKSKPVVTIKANAAGIKVSRNGKPEKPSNFVNNWAAFRATLPVKKEK